MACLPWLDAPPPVLDALALLLSLEPPLLLLSLSPLLAALTTCALPAPRCESGCKCEETTIEGHHTSQTSQTFLHSIRVSQSPQCVVSITVGPNSLSGSHKVKVVGIIVSEEGGGVTKQTSGVVGYSHDIATRDKDGFYDARNYA
jgi:hypothetical protein